MSDLFDRIANLPLEKRRALEALLERTGATPAKPTIPRRDPAVPPPLSFAQQRLWFLDRLTADPSLSLYIVPATWRMTGALDYAALEQALNAIVTRHEVLRTSFPLVDGQPIQAIRPSMRLDLPLVDLRGLAEPERAAEASRLADEVTRRSFDLACGPLVRALLLRLHAEEYQLSLAMHHTIADGWSVGILTRELAALYAACVAGAPSPLPELPIQYADFAVWQRHWLQGVGENETSPLQTQLAYWRRQLIGAPAAMSLPTDHPRPAVQSFRGTTDMFFLPATLTELLRALSLRAGCTLFMTLLAAFQILLARYSGQEDLCVGSPIAGRNRVDTEALIGLFVNTLVMRADLSGNPRFSELLQRVRSVCLGAYANQELPFEKLVEVLQPQRDLSYNPLFQVLLGLHNTPRTTSTLPNLAVERLGEVNTVSRFDLALDIREQTDDLSCALEYNTDIFEAATIERMGGHFQALLEGVVTDPERRIAELPLLTEPERRQLLVTWNATEMEFSSQESEGSRFAADSWCIHHLFEAQAERAPDAVALVFDRRPTTNDQRRDKETRRQGDKEEDSRRDPRSSILDPRSSILGPECLTYREVNRRANQLAHHLRRLGVGSEVRVGICVERSLDMIVGILGILKAGGAYVPLDPQYPPDRLAFMLEDSQAPVLVTQQVIYDLRFTISDLEANNAEIVHLKSKIVHPVVVRLDTGWETIEGENDTNPVRATYAENLAYMIYTSGSTGRPKGVQISHQSVINLLTATRPVFAFSASDVWTVVHSYAFDFSVWELWGCLLHGGRLVIAPLEVIQSPTAFYDLLSIEQVTILNQTPSAIRPLIDVQQAANSAGLALRLIMCGGEAFPLQYAARLLAWGPPVWNFYGPTEATVWAAINPIEATDIDADVVPIGRPLSNTQLYVLDSHLHPVPIGVPGELHIGGAQLARGYFNRPELTAERFIPNPFATAGDTETRRQETGGTETRRYGDTEIGSADDDPIVNRVPPRGESKIQNGDRLYKTGDLVRYLPTGEIEFLGRLDHQVKLRGFRIELAEIEAVLEQHPHVRETVIVVREDAPGDKRLVAYVVPTIEDSGLKVEDSHAVARESLSSILYPLSSELRHFLRERLPEYMAPSLFVFLEALPLSSNGKIDRRALPAPDARRPTLDVEFLPPRTELERVIAAIWQAALRVERVGVDDTFFDLGGHSLLMVQVQTKLREALGRDIPLIEMFRHPTVGALAVYFNQDHDEHTLPERQNRGAARRESRDRQQQTMQNRRQARRLVNQRKGDQDD